jgi:hypothetical protein
MKRLIVIFLLNLPTPVVAQTVYACQYTDSTGFVFQNERWQTTEFKLREPFFLRLGTDEVPDAASLKAIEFSPTSTSCSQQLGSDPRLNRLTKVTSQP